MAISLDNLRVGRRYYLKNYGEEFDFEVIEVLPNDDFRIKNVNSLEMLLFSDLINFGIGKDYELEENN